VFSHDLKQRKCENKVEKDFKYVKNIPLICPHFSIKPACQFESVKKKKGILLFIHRGIHGVYGE
jgi:hypothetical protein